MISDQEARDKIIYNTDINYFVKAGAGSGKTTSLVSRMTSMVKDGKEIEKISAITFTKKAANEFYERFHARLIKESKNPKNSDLVRKRCSDAINKIDLCFLGTIDSFCSMILKEHPVEAEVPSNITILEDENDKANEYYYEFSEIMKGAYGEELKYYAEKFSSFQFKPKQVFAKNIDIILGKRNFNFEYKEATNSYVVSLLQEISQKEMMIKNLIKYLLANKDIISETPSCSFESKQILINKRRLLLGKWDDKLPEVLRALKEIFGVVKKDYNGNAIVDDKGILEVAPKRMQITSEGFEAIDVKFADFFTPVSKTKKKYHLVMDKEYDVIELINELKYSYSMTFLVKASSVVSESLRNRGNLTFFDNLLYLRNMLKKDAAAGGKLTDHIFERHRYFLIDEFQDTNPIQSEIFFYLAAKNHNEDWTKCVPYPGSLFIVGDPKQSIYRFSNADITSYMNVESLFRGEVGEVIELTKNFRSLSPLKEYFNNLFSGMFKEELGIQSGYSEIENASDLKSGGSTCGVYSFSTKSKPEEENFINKTIQAIKILVKNPKYQYRCYTRDENKNLVSHDQMIDYKDIMVVTPSKTKLAEFQRACFENGIPCFVEGKIEYNKSKALIVLYYLFSYIVTQNKRDLINVLTSDLYKLTPAKIIKLKESNFNFEHLTDDSKGGVIENELIDLIIRLNKKKESLSSTALLESIYEGTYIYKHVTTNYLELLLNAIELLREAEDSGKVLTHHQAIEFLKDLIFNGTKERCPLICSTGNFVQIANLHKVKGLEAPVVFLVGTKSVKDPSIRCDQEMSKAWLFNGAGDGIGSSPFETKAYEFEKSLEANYDEQEKIRLLYVAATRAKNLLIIGQQANKEDTIAFNDYYGRLTEGALDFAENFNDIKVPEEKTIIEPSEIYAKTEVVTDTKDNKQKTFELIKPSNITSEKPQEDFPLEEERTTVHTNKGGKATIIGTMVHEILQAIVLSKEENVDIKNLAQKIVFEHNEMGLFNLIKEVGEKLIIEGYPQKDGVPQDLIKQLINYEAHTETPFSYFENGKLYHGIIDLIYRDEKGYHIIDYKTDAEGTDLSIHDGQLLAYKKAFETLTGEKVIDAKIYHIPV